ncbi:UbiA prenyltransferase family protein [Microlunatus speluncae]|uniref:UbiA prenyltransferase family protein n=1 Tax=Microlunatus speluncae TaxID=2594267 RepID=UPI001375C078|nr:UbiA family prenyltransferase [Microlunatus speluncae]
MADPARRRAPLLWQLLRPGTAILILLQALLCHLLLGLPAPHPVAALGGVLLIAFWYAHAVAINDLSDVAADAINLAGAGDRPLINKSASTRTVWVAAWILSGAVIVLGLVLSPWLALAGLIMVLLNLAYSLPPVRLSGRGVASQLLLPIGYVIFPAVVVWGIAGQSAVSWRGVLGVAGLYLLLVGRLFLKDIRDVEGDRRTGKRTFLVRHGLRITLVAAAVALTAGVLIMLLAIVPPLRWALIAAAVITIVAEPLLLITVYAEPELDRQLLLVGLVGRVASLWTFCCTIALAVTQWGSVPWWQQELVTALGVIMFGASAYPFAEELRRAR